MSRRDIEAGAAFVRLWLKNDLTKQMTRALRKMSTQLKSAGESMSRMGATAVRVGVVAAAPFALALKTFASFDDQMRRVQAVTGATGGMSLPDSVALSKLLSRNGGNSSARFGRCFSISPRTASPSLANYSVRSPSGGASNYPICGNYSNNSPLSTSTRSRGSTRRPGMS